ncbi:MAG: HU family DNA-binding protein [Bacilli bacterium]|nr:HU family DNA-binding protein [Bacilli bacterium]
MIKKDYIDRIVSNNEDIKRKDVVLIINQLFELMSQDLIDGETITISNFGTFEPSITKPINVYSPYDGKLIKVDNQLRIHFKTSNYIKNSFKDK